MAQTFNVDRSKGGTYSFELDAQGNYTLKKSGFGQVKTLNLPELKAEAAKDTTTTSDIKKVSDQTQKAFGDVQPFYYQSGNRNQGGGRDASQYTTEYEMTKDKSLDTSQPMVAGDTFAQARKKMTTDDAHLGKSADTITTKKADTTPAWAKGVDKRGYQNIGKDTSVKATDEIGRANVDKVLDERAKQKDLNRFSGMVGPQKISPYQDAIMRGERGVKYEKPEVLQKTTELTNTALRKVNTASNVLAKAVGFVMNPISSAIGMVAGAVQETSTNKHDKVYFNVRDDGRIAGNASTDLYAGMNRVSAFGNLERAGEKRIETREKTIQKKGYKPGDKFYDDTQKMKDQQNKYKDSKDNDPGINPSKAATVSRTDKNYGQFGRKQQQTAAGGGNSSGGKSIVCTAMYQTTGLQDWAKAMKIWYIYQKRDLTIQHQKGYHKLFKPFVKGMYKSNIIKAIGAHVAKHRTQHLKHIMFNSKPSLLGKIYNKILEPICYWVGKI